MKYEEADVTATCEALSQAYPQELVLDLYPAWFGDASPREKRLAEMWKQTHYPAIVKLMYNYYIGNANEP